MPLYFLQGVNFESPTRSSLLPHSRTCALRLPWRCRVTWLKSVYLFKGQPGGALLPLAGPGLRFCVRCPSTGHIRIFPCLRLWPRLRTAPPRSSPSSTSSGLTAQHFSFPAFYSRFSDPEILSSRCLCISILSAKGLYTKWNSAPLQMSKSQPPEPETLGKFSKNSKLIWFITDNLTSQVRWGFNKSECESVLWTLRH